MLVVSDALMAGNVRMLRSDSAVGSFLLGCYTKSVRKCASPKGKAKGQGCMQRNSQHDRQDFSHGTHAREPGLWHRSVGP